MLKCGPLQKFRLSVGNIITMLLKTLTYLESETGGKCL